MEEWLEGMILHADLQLSRSWDGFGMVDLVFRAWEEREHGEGEKGEWITVYNIWEQQKGSKRVI